MKKKSPQKAENGTNNLNDKYKQALQLIRYNSSSKSAEKPFIEYLLSRYTPNCIYIGADYQILYISGDVNDYLNFNSGISNFNLLAMIEKDLLSRVKNGIQQCRDENKDIVFNNVLNRRTGKQITLRINQADIPMMDETYLLTFESETNKRSAAIEYENSIQDNFSIQQIKNLEQEVQTRDLALQSLIEMLEKKNNEELVIESGSKKDNDKFKHAGNIQTPIDHSNWYKKLLENTPVGIYQCNRDGELIYCNDAFKKIISFNCSKNNKAAVIPWINELKGNKELWKKLQEHKVISDYEFKFKKGNNRAKHLFSSIVFENEIFSGMVLDNTDREQSRIEIIKKKEILTFAEEIGNLGSWEWNIHRNKLHLSDNAFQILGIKQKNFRNDMESLLEVIHPADKKTFEEMIQKIDFRNTRDFIVFNVIRPIDKMEKQISGISFLSFDENKNPVKVNGIIFDITEEQRTKDNLVKLNKELLDTNEKLSKTNNELRQFAYITSHDLNEPLRMITSFLGLLSKQYYDKLDNEGREYIDFAVDGAERMKKLIKDLLSYSRIDTLAAQHKHVNLGKVLDNVLLNLDTAISDSQAKIKMDQLPVVNAEPTQITQLFQNLVGNAIKFKGDKKPEIKIIVKDEEAYWEFVVVDNGIGIKKEYFDKIFGIFERLHSREEYEGTGIGLAICKKIVERHDGKIWVESEPGNGAAFHFTLPK